VNDRGSIKRTETGWSIHPGTWREPRAAQAPAAVLGRGRIVRVTFDMILSEDASRATIEEETTDRLNENFDLCRDPILEDIGVRTDKPELLERALYAPSAAKDGTTDRQPSLREDLPSPKASTSNEG
jgi:hypothetical protein